MTTYARLCVRRRADSDRKPQLRTCSWATSLAPGSSAPRATSFASAACTCVRLTPVAMVHDAMAHDAVVRDQSEDDLRVLAITRSNLLIVPSHPFDEGTRVAILMRG